MSDPLPTGDAMPETGRLFGRSRALTAVAVSQYAYPDGSAEVYLARDDDVVDAVVAGVLTAGPVLLVARAGRVPGAVLAEVARLDPPRVLALGGTRAVSTETLRTVAGRRRMGRLAGATRLQTAVAVSRHAFPRGAAEVYLARSDLLVDAVAAGSLTAGPVLLVPPVGPTPNEVVAEVARLDPRRVLALGGPVAVPQERLTEVAAGRPMGRLDGATRYATAVAVSRHQFPDGAGAVYVASADALADAVVAGSLTGGPVLLVPRCDTVPAVVREEVERLRPSRVVAVGGPAAVCTRVLLDVAGRLAHDCGPPGVEDRGPAATASPVVGAALDGDRLYVASRARLPMVVAAVDLTTQTIDRVTELPTGEGGWAMGVRTDGVLVGTYRPADVYRLDKVTLRAWRVAELDPATHIFTLAVGPDGTTAMGTSPDGGVYAYSPQGHLRAYGPAVAGQYYVRSLAVTAETIYAGIGSQAHLVAIDRRTGERRPLLPPTLAGESFVYALAVSSRWLVAGTEPSGRVAVIPLADPDAHRVLPDLGERTVDAILIDGDVVWFTGRSTGALYRYDMDSDTPRRVAVPLHREETRGLFAHRGAVIGVGGTGVLWRYDPDSGAVATWDLAALGLPGGPEPVQSLAVAPSTIFVGAHWAVETHALQGADAGRPPGANRAGAASEASEGRTPVRRQSGRARRFRVPGEPKAMVETEGVLYMALYPAAELWRSQTGSEATELVAAIGHEQARPRRIAVQPSTGNVLVVSQADYGRRGGALAVYDPRSGQLSVHRDVVAQHGLSALAVDGDVAYVGSEVGSGGGLPPAPGPARVVAWDLRGRRLLWEVAPVADAIGMVGLVAAHGLVYGLTAHGVAFSLDPRTGGVVRTVRDRRRGRALVLHLDHLFAAFSVGIHRLDLDSLAATPVPPGGNVLHLGSGPECRLIAVRDTRLLEVTPVVA